MHFVGQYTEREKMHGMNNITLIIFTVYISKKTLHLLISSFRRVLYVVCFLLGNSHASGAYMPTFRNILSVPSS